MNARSVGLVSTSLSEASAQRPDGCGWAKAVTSTLVERIQVGDVHALECGGELLEVSVGGPAAARRGLNLQDREIGIHATAAYRGVGDGWVTIESRASSAGRRSWRAR
jgi:hypothetical protein